MDNAQTHYWPRQGTTEGDWWRFSSYEIRDGCIRPSEGAKLEWYDPWPAFQGTRKQTIGQAPQGAQPSYQSLSKLVHQLEYLPGHKRYPDCLTKKSQDAILEWCQQYGLLGVLLSRWEAINLSPHCSERGMWFQSRYFRTFGQVVQRIDAEGDLQDRSANVLIHELNSLEVTEEPPSKTWGCFFPSVEIGERNTFFYPQPYTEEFCYLYGERLIDFCNAAKLLAGAMWHLSGKQGPIEGDAQLARTQALDVINLLRRPVSSVLDFDKRGLVKPRRVAPSLLASFADMFAQDQVFGQATIQCTCCGTPFVSNAYQAKYCSVTCRMREQKRNLRAQMKNAKALRSQGQSLREIAAELKQPLVTVKGWLRNKR